MRPAITRLDRFGYLGRTLGYRDVCGVRTQIPPLSRCLVERLPISLRNGVPSG